MKALLQTLLLACASLMPAAAAAPPPPDAKLLGLLPITIDVEITGNHVSAEINAAILPWPVDIELLIDFGDATGLSLQNLGLSARLVNPLDPALIARMPSGGLLGVPVSLPLLIRVEPPRNGTLQFTNTVGVELHTHILPFTIQTPLRIYKAPLGGQFFDITSEVASGSIRTRGRTGDFSEFLIVVDLRPSVIAAEPKLEFLEERVATAAISPAARAAIEPELAAVRAAFDLGNKANAIAALDRFTAAVQLHAGTGIPNRWRAARDLDNVAGSLLGEAATLRFSLTRTF